MGAVGALVGSTASGGPPVGGGAPLAGDRSPSLSGEGRPFCLAFHSQSISYTTFRR